jgi:hypothetical protein
VLATLFTYDGKGLAFTPDGSFVGDLPMDELIALNRRDSLADALAPKAAK